MRRWRAAALLVIAGCQIRDLTFYKPVDDAASSEPPPSCAALTLPCGADQRDCCASLEVPGGAFYRDHDLANSALSGGTNYPAAIRGFRLDKFDVTVARFRQFVLAGMGTQDHPPAPDAGQHPGFPGTGWDPAWNASLSATTDQFIKDIKCSMDKTWTDIPHTPEDENRPINCLTWYEAMAFCIWDGGYLPSEAEWNYAAHGGGEQRAYPWSFPAGSLEIDFTFVSYSPDSGTNCSGDGMAGCAATDIVPVGTLTKSDGRWEHSDLAGNLYQWLFDWYDVYRSCEMGCLNTMVPDSPDPLRGMRGGAFVYGPEKLRSAARGNSVPRKRNYIIGARCARPLVDI